MIAGVITSATPPLHLAGGRHTLVLTLKAMCRFGLLGCCVRLHAVSPTLTLI